MSRPLKLDDTSKNSLIESFKKYIDKISAFNGKIEFSEVLKTTSEKQTTKIYYTLTAYTKLTALVASLDDEVAWMGVCERVDDGFLISDIVVYPQEVSGSTVTVDNEAYAKWEYEHRNDPRFGKLFMQGHSHVNMGVSPSSTDEEHQKSTVSDMSDNGFFVFQIWNKKHEHYSIVYDARDNVIYENKDISVLVIDGEGLGNFIKDSLSNVKKKSYAAISSTPATSSGNWWEDKYGKSKKTKKDSKEKYDDDDWYYFR